MSMNISTLISYCSLDQRFIVVNIKECLKFSDDIIVVSFDRLLNGDIEELATLDTIKAVDPTRVRIMVLPYDSRQGPRHHHNTARWQAQKYTKHNTILFLDADEIAEGAIVKDILRHPDMPDIHAMSFSCYWYFRSARYQATTTESSPMLINKTRFRKQHYFTDGERWGFAWNNPNYIEAVTGPHGAFFHHFSWARTKQEMLIKTASWGHKNDRDWHSLIEKEFSHDFNGTDFVHGYSYNIVEDHFNLGI